MKKNAILFGATLLTLHQPLLSANFLPDSSGNWATGSRWSGGEPPTRTEDVFVRSGTQTVYVTTDGNVGNRLTLGQSDSKATLDIRQNGNLELTGEGTNYKGALYYAWGGDGTTHGIINLSSGSLKARQLQGGVNSIDDIGRINISGGELIITENFVSGGFLGAESSVNIFGNAATTISISNNSTFSNYSTLSFNFNGGDSVSLWQTSNLIIEIEANLEIVGSDSMVAGSRYQLTSYDTITGSFGDNYNITGLADGLTGVIEYDDDGMFLAVNAVPEPSSVLFLGLSSLALLRRQRT